LPVYPLLALLWAMVLVPPMLRGRVRHRAELAEFDRIQLCFAGSADPVTQERDDATVAALRPTAAQRRRRVLAVIGATLVTTLAVALVVRTRVAWGMHLLAYDVLIGYVGLLARSRDKRPIRAPRTVVAAPVRQLPRPAPAGVPQLGLLQAASR
jgi:hypothetical protein